jgi:hypothetical protein
MMRLFATVAIRGVGALDRIAQGDDNLRARNIVGDSIARDLLAEIVRIDFAQDHLGWIGAKVVEIPRHPIGVILEEEIGLLGPAREPEMGLHHLVQPSGSGTLRPDCDKIGQARCVSHARKLSAALRRSNMLAAPGSSL